MTATTGTVVNREVMAVMDTAGQEVGALVFWDLHGQVDPEALEEAWNAEGLDTDFVPEPPSPKKALARAMDNLAEGRRLRRPLAGRQGYSLVLENAEEERLDYSQQVTAKVDALGVLDIQPPDHPLAGSIRHEYWQATSYLSHGDLSGMLISFTESLLAVGLRGRGGFYFLPPDKVPTFRAAARALKAVSGVVCHEIPAMRSEGAVEAILSGVSAEIAQSCKEMEEKLDDKEIGERGLNSQINHCLKAEQKIAAYAKLLGTNLDHLTGEMEAIRARLTEAALLAASMKKKS